MSLEKGNENESARESGGGREVVEKLEGGSLLLSRRRSEGRVRKVRLRLVSLRDG